MTGVRNGVLARKVTTGAGAELLGTVPANFVWLLKAVHVTNLTATAAKVTIQLTDSAVGVAASLPELDVAPGVGVMWSGWTALNSGDHVYVIGAAGVHVWATGASLPGVI